MRSGVRIAHLPYRSPFDWAALLAHLEARAVLGVEEVEDGAYRRTVAMGRRLGTVEVRHQPEQSRLAVAVRGPGAGAMAQVLSQVRRVFDVDAEVEMIGVHLSRDPSLAALVARRPGLRVPGGWDAFELAVRAILGQRVTVVAARRLAGRLATLCGSALPPPGCRGTLSRAFPSPDQVAGCDLDALGMPGARRAALRTLAEAAIADPHLFHSRGTVEEAVARLRAIRGIGAWTAHYIALRALRQMDAFRAADIGLLRGFAGAEGARPTPAELLRRAEAWRPWRGYAAQHLWAADAST
jgi:AraC family transcriptional regulator of adaptative response / DNA-3-methyladenine glycosylase II